MPTAARMARLVPPSDWSVRASGVATRGCRICSSPPAHLAGLGIIRLARNHADRACFLLMRRLADFIKALLCLATPRLRGNELSRLPRSPGCRLAADLDKRASAQSSRQPASAPDCTGCGRETSKHQAGTEMTERQDVLSLAAQIVSAHVKKNAVAPDALPGLIREVFSTLTGSGEGDRSSRPRQHRRSRSGSRSSRTASCAWRTARASRC